MQNFVFLVITLSTQNNIKLLKQSESGFKKTINWNKYHSKKRQAQNKYLDFLILPKFQAICKVFVLSFNNDDGRKS